MKTYIGKISRCLLVMFVILFSSGLTRKVFIQRAKVSVTATNLLTFSALNEWNLDPEFPSGRANYYPQSSVYSLGLNLEF